MAPHCQIYLMRKIKHKQADRYLLYMRQLRKVLWGFSIYSTVAFIDQVFWALFYDYAMILEVYSFLQSVQTKI